MKLLLISAVLVAFASAVKVPFKDCGSTKGKILSVDINPCDNPKLCTLKKGTSPRVSVSFTSKEEITALQAKVAGIIPGGVKVPFPLDQPDACQSGLSCPIANNVNSTYSETIGILESYPDWKVIVQWQLVDQNDQLVVCFVVATKIAP